MARIQILELPTQVVGEHIRTPFSIIIDQVQHEVMGPFNGATVRHSAELTQDEADRIARGMGAVSAVLLACTMDLA